MDPTGQEHVHDEPHEEPVVRRIAPPPGLLFVLVASLVVTAAAVVLLGSGGEDRTLQLGRLEALLDRARAGPVQLAELPHLAVVLTSTDEPVYDAIEGLATGTVLVDPTTRLAALELRDPVDGATLTWCRSAAAFEHPDGVRTYGLDGRVLTGDAPHGMDRRALRVVPGGAVEVDDGRWVSGVPRSGDDGAYAPRGASCVQD